MGKRLLHTPEGVRDIYGVENEKKMQVESLFHEKLKIYGFRDIQTPTFEFFDVFSKEIGTTPSRELYKFFDSEGHTLVLRPDFTPSIARCAAKYFMDEEYPVRFCYFGNTFTNTSNLQGKLKEVTQMGVELIGDDSVEADGEMISLVIDALLNTGLKDFQVSIGQVDFFRGLCLEAGIDEPTEIELREFISTKNHFAAEELLNSRYVDSFNKDIILKVTDFFGGIEILKEAKNLVKNTISLGAIERLESLYNVLCLYNMEQYVSFDLGMLSKYNYYTGIIFKAYTYGVGDAIVKGGRYNDLLARFGKNAAAIGFVVCIDDLMIAMNSQKIKLVVQAKNYMILYHANRYKEAIEMAKRLRNNEERTEMIPIKESNTLEDYIAFAKNHLFCEIINLKIDGTVEIIHI